MKKTLMTLLKVAVVGGLFWFLTRKGLISMEATKKAFEDGRRMTIAFAGLFFTFALGIVRWNLLLRAQHITLSWTRVFQICLIGNFFNIALPGAISGDLVKAYYIGKEGHGKKGHAFGTILLDRIIGLSALIIVSCGALILGFKDFWGSSLFHALQALIILGTGGVLFFFGYLFFVKNEMDPMSKLLARLEAKKENLGALKRIHEGVCHYRDHRGVVIQALILSTLIHSIVGFSLYEFAHALGELHTPLKALYLVFPLGMFVTAIPVLPAGIGTGHAAFSYLFMLFQSSRGADVYSLFALSQLLLGGLGGLVYLQFKSEIPKDLTSSS